MKTTLIFVLAAGAAMCAQLQTEEHFTLIINQGWQSGQDFLASSKGVQAATATGIVSGLFMSPLMGALERGPKITALSECTTGMTPIQLGAIVEKYLRDHPGRWNVAISISTVQAMQSACPAFDAAMTGEAAPAPPKP